MPRAAKPSNLNPKAISSILSKIKITYVLGFLLIVCAFLIGVLYTKIQYLEKGGGVNTQAQGAVPSPAPAGYYLGDKVDLGKDRLPILGKSDAKVKIVEYADFQCPFCEKWFTDIESSLIKDYVNTGKVSLSFRQYAFLDQSTDTAGPESTQAANASECANEQGKFWEYHDYLYTHQGQENSGAFSIDNLKGFAATLGLDTVKFNSCLDANKYNKDVQDDLAVGQKVGVSGTPATFINGKMVLTQGNSAGALPYAEFKKLIDAELK